MKRLLLINSVCGIGSTGRICVDIAHEYEAEGYEVKIAYGRSDKVGEGSERYAVRIGSRFDLYTHALCTRLFDKHGLASINATRKLLKWADEYDPDILWLHNIHGYYINYEILFDWIKTRQKMQAKSDKPVMEVKWTLHDCWAFTGHCSHFTFVGCDKWKTGCKHCPQKGEYPASSMLDNSEENYRRKKDAFAGVENLTIITPSHWLEELVKQCFLGEYPTEVRYNTVDMTVFKPTPSDFRQKHGIRDDQIMILGVSSVWNDRKGLNDFIELSRHLDQRYVVVIVGIDGRQANQFSDNVITLESITDSRQLAAVYSSSDFFVNPSLEETFSLTTLEALMCGTKTIVYKGTACEEVANKYGGFAVIKGYQNIISIIQKEK